RGGDKLFTHYAFSSVDGFLVQSDAVAKDLNQLLPDAKYRRVEHPVYEIFGDAINKSEARASLGLKNERIILFFGYIRSYKGLDILLEAMNIILRHIDVQLLVVGEFYEDEERYHELTKTLGIAHRVNFVSEYVPNNKVASYFSAADCVVLPYRSATQSGIVQIAYNFNKPVIVTQVGGLAEVVKDGVAGFIVPPDDPIALADAVIKFYSSNYEQQFYEGIQREKKRFSWQTLVDDIDAFVKEIQNEKVKA
ncbi:MAG: glycosyltransferase, partial [Bacteroidetes bacterium]|nr:glycosyltransferase [Bacteroidota bacterium]